MDTASADKPVLTPLTARRGGPVAGPRPGAGRQIDLAPGPDSGRAHRGREHGQRAFGRRGRIAHGGRHARARRQGRARRRRYLAHSRRRRRRLCRACRPARLRQFRHRLRLALGAVAGSPITASFDGDASLRKRPMRRVLDPLEKMGARVIEQAEGGRLPLTLKGARDPLPITYELPVPSAQLKSAVLLAGLAAPGETTVIEAEATRDHTERLLKHFGAKVVTKPYGEHGRRITLTGQPELEPARGRGAGRSVLGGVPAGCGADRTRLRGDPRSGDDQSVAHRLPHHAA